MNQKQIVECKKIKKYIKMNRKYTGIALKFALKKKNSKICEVCVTYQL